MSQNKMKLKVFASLAEDINSGWVWVPERVISERTTICLLNIESGKKVYCEALKIGKNVFERYNYKYKTCRISDRDKSIVMSEWYRKKLQISSTRIEVAFSITKSENLRGHLMASCHHPQSIVRLATILAVISILLGILGLVLGIAA